ncbi:MAG: hypothetical protein P4L71_03280 [Acetobacteraceae bacterium]|nr:hypothetical protein [Acetobacteraceae bacterium]
MNGRFQAFLTQHIVAEVPTEMEACLDCDAIHCAEARYRTCPRRLERAAALVAADEGVGAADRDHGEPRPPLG